MQEKCLAYVDDPEHLAYPCGIEGCPVHDKKELVGYASGDNECFCWNVKQDVFVNLTGRQPGEFEKACFHNDHYRIYPCDIFPEIFLQGKKKINFVKVKKDNKITIVIVAEDLPTDPKEIRSWDE